MVGFTKLEPVLLCRGGADDDQFPYGNEIKQLWELHSCVILVNTMAPLPTGYSGEF